MKHWRVEPLGNHCEVQNGFPFPSEFFDSQEGTPLIRVRSLKTQSCDMRIKGLFDDTFLVKNGDVLIGMDGDFQPCLWQGGDSLLNQRVCRLKSFSTRLDPYFTYLALKEPLRRLEDVTHFTTVKHLSSSTLKEIEIPLPPFPEQRAIAHFLRTVQDAKDARQRELTLERERKAALLEHLFTNGTRGEATKQCEIGEIPSSWTILPLSQVASVERGKFSHRPRNDPAFYGGVTPFIQTGDVTASNGHITQHTQTLNEKGLAVSRVFPKGTIVITIAANIGFTAILDYDSAFPDSLIGITPRSSIDAEYLNYFLMTQQQEMDGKAPRGTQKNINIEFLNPWFVPVPPFEEQQVIAKVLQWCDMKITTLQDESALLSELFNSMLEELMTGKVGVDGLIDGGSNG